MNHLPAPAPRARNTDPQPSHDAATNATHHAHDDQTIVLQAHANAGQRGLTGNELAETTGRDYSKIGPRRPALERDGFVEKAFGEDGKRMRRGGQGVYRVTAKGIAAVDVLNGRPAA